MAWPYSPLTTYVASSTPSIKAADLNAIQIAINTLYGGLGLWGDGSDGNLTVGTGVTFHLTGHKNYDVVSMNIGAIRTNGWAILAKTSFTMQSSSSGLQGLGGSAVGNARGIYNTNSQPGGPHGSIAPGAGLSSGAYEWGGVRQYGLGGNGGIGGGSGPAPTSIIDPGGAYRTFPFRSCAGRGDTGIQLVGSTDPWLGHCYDSIRGGGAGAPGGISASATAGGPGAGGALVVVISPTITVNGSVSSAGGDGGSGSSSGGAAHGGGAGGGGAFLFVCRQFIDNGAIYTAPGGTGGLGVSGGSAGANGSTGNTTPFVVLVP